ncbi:enolase C-terminal domain-like protein [Humibacter sp. RRB41]|uniref:enolase C-terminal domain-like protein n=1 Tax=Humibacter sp. RRB41 TaxID=2919946 RepID=UPI001FA95ECF|nr:enolase C-terminal domain-like protein [Humibacter sp. RRB41]
MRTSKISKVEVHRLTGQHPDPLPGDHQRQVQAIDLYESAREPLRVAAGGRERPTTISRCYLRIETDDGAHGLYGPIDELPARVVLDVYRELLMGQDALASSTIWDQLERVDRHSRHGLHKAAISAIDNTLWDLRGRVLDAPVWQLLGGGSRRSIPAYASMLGTPLDAESVRAAAAQAQAKGFAGQKWFFEHGPASGPAGLRANVELVREVREAVGPDEPIMFDAYHGWDLPFARAWARRVEQYRPDWLEEPLLPNRHAAFAELRRSTAIPIATGEHVYDRQEALDLLADGSIAVLQCDPEWCGGVTELVRMSTLAETFGVPLIPHGHGIHAALHVIASQSPEVCPKAEYLWRMMPVRHHFETDAPAPVNGAFRLPTGPGFGIRIDESKVQSDDVLAA